MNKRWFMLLLVTLTMLLTACMPAAETKETDSVTMLTGIYEKSAVEVDDNLTYVRNMTVKDGKIYMYSTLIEGEERVGTVMILDPADDSIVYEPMPNVSYASVFAVGDGGYLFILSGLNQETYTEMYTLYYIENGTVVWTKPLEEFLSYDHLQQMPTAVWHGGLWYIGVNMTLLTVDNGGNLVKTYSLPADPYEVFVYEDTVHIWGSAYHYTIDGSGEFAEDAAWLEALKQVQNGEIYLGNGYDFYYIGEETLIGCDIGGESVGLLNWVNCGFLPDRIQGIAVISPQTVYIYGNDGLGGDNMLMKFTAAPDREMDRTVIRVGYMNSGTSNIDLAAVQFNQAQTEYQVICENYGESGGDDVGMNGLDAAILRGETADLLLFDSMDEVMKYAEQGLLTDLYTLMDEDFSEDDLFGCVKEASEIGGALYGLPRDFELSVFSAKTANLPEYDVWDVGTYLETARNLPEGMAFSENDSQKFMTVLLMYMLSEWVDTETNTCRFDDGSFAAMLEYIASLPETENVRWGTNENPYAADKLLLYGDVITNYASYAVMRSVFGGWNMGTVVGFPSSEDGACVIRSDEYFAVSASSENKEGAIEFLNYLVSAECMIGKTERIRGMKSIPALKSTMKSWEGIEGEYVYRIYTDRVGDYAGGAELTLEEDTGRPYVEVSVSDFMEEFYTFLDTVPAYSPIPAEIQTIVMEEVSAFLGMGKSPESCADVVQSRVSLWLSEHD